MQFVIAIVMIVAISAFIVGVARSVIRRERRIGAEYNRVSARLEQLKTERAALELLAAKKNGQ